VIAVLVGVNDIEDLAVLLRFGLNLPGAIGVHRGVNDQHSLAQNYHRGIDPVPQNNMLAHENTSCRVIKGTVLFVQSEPLRGVTGQKEPSPLSVPVSGD